MTRHNYQYSLVCIGLASLVTTQPAFSYDLTRATESALSSHPLIQSKIADSDAADKNLKGAAWQMAPTVTYSNGKNAYGNVATTTRIQLPLFSGGQTVGSIRESSFRRDGSYADILAAEQTVLSKVVDSYMDLNKSISKVEIANSNLSEHERLYQMIIRRHKAGVSSLNDVTTAEMRLQQALAEVEQYRSLYLTSRSLLEELTSETIPEQEKIIPPKTKDLGIKNLSDAISLALEFSPEITSQRAKASAADAHITVQRSALLPQVSLRHDIYAGQVFGKDRVTYVNIDYQLNSGISSVYALGSSASQYQSAVNMVDATQKDVLNTLKRDWNQYQFGAQQVNLIGKQFKASKDVMDSFLRQYVVGKKSWIEVLNAQREMAQAEYTLVDAQSNYQQSKLHVAITTGILTRSNMSLLTETASK